MSTNTQYYQVTTLNTIPNASTQLSGTASGVSGRKTIIGVSTSFLTEIPEGLGWVRFNSDPVLYKIDGIVDNELLYLTTPLQNNYTNAQIYFVPNSRAKYIKIIPNGAATVNGNSLTTPIEYFEDDIMFRPVDPLIVQNVLWAARY